MPPKKTNVLAAALSRLDDTQDNQASEASIKEQKKRKPIKNSTAKKASREGTVLVGGHFAPSVKTTLRVIAAEENTTSQALIEEALNLLFVKKGKSKIV